MHFIIMSYFVSDTNRTRKALQDVSFIMIVTIVAPTNTTVGPVHVSFVSNPWARSILTEDTYF